MMHRNTLFIASIVLFSIMLGISLTNIAISENPYERVRIESFKYTYKIDEVPGENYFIYSGDGFLGYYHVSDICGGQYCRYIPASSVIPLEDFSKIRDLEDRVIGILRNKYELEIPYRGVVYLVNDSVVSILLPVFELEKNISIEKIELELEPVLDNENVTIVLKIIPRSLIYDPRAVEEAIARLTPILDYIYNVSDTPLSANKTLIKELEKALMDLNDGELPGVSFSMKYKIHGCLGIVLDGVKEKPSRENIVRFIKVLRDIVGNNIPIVIEAEQGSPIPLGDATESIISDSNYNYVSMTSILLVLLGIGITIMLLYLVEKHK